MGIGSRHIAPPRAEFPPGDSAVLLLMGQARISDPNGWIVGTPTQDPSGVITIEVKEDATGTADPQDGALIYFPMVGLDRKPITQDFLGGDLKFDLVQGPSAGAYIAVGMGLTPEGDLATATGWAAGELDFLGGTDPSPVAWLDAASAGGGVSAGTVRCVTNVAITGTLTNGVGISEASEVRAVRCYAVDADNNTIKRGPRTVATWSTYTEYVCALFVRPTAGGSGAVTHTIKVRPFLFLCPSPSVR